MCAGARPRGRLGRCGLHHRSDPRTRRHAPWRRRRCCGVHRRPHGPITGAAHGRRGAAALRTYRHRGQQRRHGERGHGRRELPRLHRHERCRLGSGHRDEPAHGLQRHQAHRARHDRARLGPDRDGVVGDGPVRHEPRLHGLRRRQGRHGRPDARPRPRTRTARDHRELGPRETVCSPTACGASRCSRW